jgi:Ca2+-dependent lipid-binding protein
VLIIRILSASIRRKTSTVSDMKCVARFTIGEATDETQISKDTKESPPVWKDVFRMYVIGSSMTGKLQVFDVGISGDTLVGECEVDIKELMDEPVGKEHSSEIMFQDSIAGTVKFIAAYANLEQVGVENRQRII